MLSLVLAALISALACLALTPLLRRLMQALGFVEPHETRNVRTGPIPRMGGLAVLVAAGLGTSAPSWFHTDVARQVRPDSVLIGRLLLPVLLVLALGMLDDAFGVSPRFKLLIQVIAAWLVYQHGIRVSSLFGETLPHWASVLLTLVWLVGCTNAFNLLDGLDGLATGIALFSTITVLIHALLNGNLDLALLTGSLAAALIGFLYFNFFPASIFLGDAGSLSIGFLLGCFALLWADKATTLLGLTAPLLALLVPLFDTGVSIVRRWLAHQPIFEGDHSHVHHRLVQLGLTPRNAVLLLYGVAAVGACCGLLLANLRQQHVNGLVVFAFIATAGIGIHLLGYAEFTEATRLWRRGLADQRQIIHCRLELRKLLESIESAEDWNGQWRILCQITEMVGLDALEFRVGTAQFPIWQQQETIKPGERSKAAPIAFPGDRRHGFPGWSMQIPLGDAGELGAVTLWGTSPDSVQIPLQDLAAGIHDTLTRRMRSLLLTQLVQASRSAAQGTG